MGTESWRQRGRKGVRSAAGMSRVWGLGVANGRDQDGDAGGDRKGWMMV